VPLKLCAQGALSTHLTRTIMREEEREGKAGDFLKDYI
jgi:hypothetical protein